ncbi:MAG: ABC transporter permease, partial [Gemmatimonadales bacterium]
MPESPEPMWRRYLRFFGPDLRRDIDDELAFHFAERLEELRGAGLDDVTARRQAVAEFGDLPSVRKALERIDRGAAQRRGLRLRLATALSGAWSDLRFALRSLSHAPGAAAAAAGSMALAIGVNITMFAGADAIVRPFSVPEPERLVRIWSSQPTQGWERIPTSLLDFYDWRDRLESVDLGASRGIAYNWADGNDADRVYGVEVTAGYLALHAVPVLLGREFDRADEVAGLPITMIGERFWKNRLGGDPNVVGRTVRLDGLPHAVVGVVSGQYNLPGRLPGSDVWVPLVLSSRETRASRSVTVIGRLRPSGTIETVRSEVAALAKQQQTEHPETNREVGVLVDSVREAEVSREARRIALALLIAVGLVLLIACANVTNLLLARTVERGQELAIRSALGATRGRLVCLVMTEGVIIAAVGGMLGFVLSAIGLVWIGRVSGTNELGQAFAFDFSPRIFAYGLAVTACAALIVGLFPAVRRDARVAGRLRHRSRSETTGRPHGRLRNVLVGGQLAMAVVLLTIAGLAIKSNLRLLRTDTGVSPAVGATFSTVLSTREFPDSIQVLGFAEAVKRRLLEIPGVTIAGIGSRLPIRPSVGGVYYTADTQPDVPEQKRPIAQLHAVDEDYFRSWGIRMVVGRSVGRNDRFESPRVVVVNEQVAARHWPGLDPIGRHLRFAGRDWLVVGVAADVHQLGIQQNPPPAVYVPNSQSPRREIHFSLATTLPLDQLGRQARAAVGTVAPGQPIVGLETLDAHVARALREPRLLAELFGMLGIVGVVLAVMGVYGLTAFMVSQRTSE